MYEITFNQDNEITIKQGDKLVITHLSAFKDTLEEIRPYICEEALLRVTLLAKMLEETN